MPIKTKTLKIGRTKCYLHEMQRPLELPYDRFKYHICWICQTRLRELAKANYHFPLDQQVITISLAPKVQEDAVILKRSSNSKKKQQVQKEAA